MKLENNVLCVEIAELGAEVTRIFDKERNTEVLWNGDEKFWKGYSPILFPNIGKAWGDHIQIDGIQYPASKHGFARNTRFDCVSVSEEKISFMMHSTEETKEVYPYDFELYVNYQLKGKELEVEWQVRNCADKSMYFTIGGHPAFCFAEKGEVKTDYCLKFPGKDKLEYLGLDLPTGTIIPDSSYPMLLKDGYYPLSEEMFQVDTFIFGGGQVDEVWLCKRDGTPYVGLKCEEFSNLGIWSPAGAPFVCLEPWAGCCDNYEFEGEISEKPAINSVKSGETFVKKYQIIVA